MKINGKSVQIREVLEVKLSRSKEEDSIVLKVCGYPIGIRRAYEAVYPKPTPPVVVSNVVKVGQKLDTTLDYNSPEYEQKIGHWLHLNKFFMLHKCLSVDKTLVFENDCSTVASLEKFAKELDDAGLSEGDIGVIFDTIERATRIEPKAVKEAEETFPVSLTPPVA